MASDPFSSLRFQVEIDGIATGQFREVSGLTSSIDVIEYQDGSEPGTIRKIPGRTKYANITLKSGMTSSMELHDWHKKLLSGELDRRNLAIILLDATGAGIARWNVTEAWPCKYEGPHLNAESSEVAIETFELAHSGMTREQ